MKSFALRSILTSIIAITIAMPVVSSGSIYAQSASARSAPAQEQAQYPQDELETLRSKLLELTDTVKEFSDAVTPGNTESAERLVQARKQIEQLSYKELNMLRSAVDPSKMNVGLVEARATIADFKPAFETYYKKKSKKGFSTASVGFPDRDAPDSVCAALIGTGRPSSALLIATTATYVAAEIIKEIASRGCNEVLVVLGEGGNGSLVCLVTDAVYFVAKGVYDKVLACDADFAKRTVDGAYQRLEHVHADLDRSITNDNANTTTITGAVSTATMTITANDNTNKTAIVANDNTNAASIIANANANKGDVIVNANSNTTAITTAIANLQTAIIANATANKNELRDLILRTQIEADLGQADSAIPIALYETPNANGGYLDLVKTILTATLANIQAAGGDVSAAQPFLTQANAANAAGQFKNAYVLYRKAYKAAAK